MGLVGRQLEIRRKLGLMAQLSAIKLDMATIGPVYYNQLLSLSQGSSTQRSYSEVFCKCDSKLTLTLVLVTMVLDSL